MAELTTSSGNTSGRKGRSIKSLPKVDLTAMVDLAFLLITFFMLTTSLAKERAMPLAMPIDGPGGQVADNRALTICIGDRDKAFTYQETVEDPQRIHVMPVSQIRQSLLSDMQNIKKISGKNAIVIIKPTVKSNFKNLVDILDELSIVNAPYYSIADITSADLKLLKEHEPVYQQ